MRSRLLLALLLLFALTLPARAEGHLKPHYGKGTGEFTRTLVEEFKKARLLEDLAAGLDGIFALPRDVTLSLEETPQPRNHYDPQRHRIVISLNFIEQAARRLFSTLPDQSRAAQVTGGLVVFSIIETYSMALIRELDLPTTGEDEDAAAELTTLIMAEEPDGQLAAVSTALWFRMLAEDKSSLDQLEFWSASSLDQQRYYDILGYLYAADPRGYQFVTQEIPQDRLARAQEEYPRKKHNWERLLTPYLRAGSDL